MFDISSLPEEIRYNRPEAIDFGSIERIRQIRPVEKAAGPIVDHNLDLIDAVRRVRPWYLGKRAKTPGEILSRLLDPTCNSACQKLGAFVSAILDFRPGAFPAHCSAVRQLQFTTTMLLRELDTTIDSPAVKGAFSVVDAFFAALSASGNFLLDTDSYDRRIKASLEELLRTFGEIAAAFHLRERQRDAEIAFSKMPPVTLEDVKTVAAEAAQTAAQTAAEDVKKTVRKAKRDIITDAHTDHQSEADRRGPKGERGKQIAAVRKLLREARDKGRKLTIRQACSKCWTNIKDGYPNVDSLYRYCHAHESELA